MVKSILKLSLISKTLSLIRLMETLKEWNRDIKTTIITMMIKKRTKKETKRVKLLQVWISSILRLKRIGSEMSKFLCFGKRK